MAKPSEQELRKRFFDEGHDNWFSLDQFFIREGRPDLAKGRKLYTENKRGGGSVGYTQRWKNTRKKNG